MSEESDQKIELKNLRGFQAAKDEVSRLEKEAEEIARDVATIHRALTDTIDDVFVPSFPTVFPTEESLRKLIDDLRAARTRKKSYARESEVNQDGEPYI